jgi:hypothetical protein
MNAGQRPVTNDIPKPPTGGSKVIREPMKLHISVETNLDEVEAQLKRIEESLSRVNEGLERTPIDGLDKDLILYHLLSERYHKLLNKPDERDEYKFRKIANLYLEYKEKKDRLPPLK